MVDLWPFLLPAAAYSGWWVAHRQNTEAKMQTTNRLSREYVVGLNYLLNEQPDKAVDIFIKLLEVDTETVETHLALGSLFRRRGEVDRAIRIHQNLIARPQLGLSHRREALMALGQDYMRAGVFDRAERIFLEVVDTGTGFETNSLQGLLAIYQQEKSWEKALDILKKLEKSTGTDMCYKAAHYYCEIAEQYLKTDALEKALFYAKQALSTDKQSVRASLLLADIQMQLGSYKAAVQTLEKVPDQDPEFIAEILEPLALCHQKLESIPEGMLYLQKLLEAYPGAALLFVIAEYVREQHGIEAGIDFVAEKLRLYPSVRGLNRLIDWHLEAAYGKVKDKLQMLHNITSTFLDNKPIYRCGHCGFGAKHIFWHCPSCKQWGRMKPIHGLEGD